MKKLMPVIVSLLLGSVAYAQAVDVPGLVKLIETQPPDLDRPAWKEKRRDAAKKLAQSKDKKAVPELIKLADTETFDIIGEIAIEGLGNLGDPSAVPTLQKIVGDPARDPHQKDLAKRALAKLGAGTATTPPPPPHGGGSPPHGGGTPPDTTATTTTTTTATPPDTTATTTAPDVTATTTTTTSTESGAGLLGTPKSATDVPPLPELPDDTLASYERVTFAGGGATFGYDTLRKRMDFDADVAGSYARRVEREKMAWGWDASAHVVTGLINAPGSSQQRGAEVVAQGDGEARFYSGQIYGVGKVAVAAQLNYVSDVDQNGNAVKFTNTYGDLQLALGGGYGRVLDIGAAIRVRRLSHALDANRALGKPIDAATSKKLQLTWWALRGERSGYRQLIATVAVLREAGILLGEPDAGLTYEILNVLRDTQLFVRPSGFDAQLTFGEGYLDRPNGDSENGRVEQLMALAGYGAQLDEDKLEVTGSGYARLRLFAPDMQPAPWAVGATARMTRFTYGEHGDPFGALDLGADVMLSSDDQMNSDKELRITGELGFSYWLNQASGLRLAAQVAEDRGALFIGAQLQATYGLLDGTFAR
jgi:hypothetical protein